MHFTVDIFATHRNPWTARYSIILKKYNTNDNPIGIFKILNYQKKYALATGAVLLILLIIWYLVGLPIGINVMPTI